MLLLPLMLLAGCDLPRDVAGTSERVARDRQVRVVVAGDSGPAGARFLVALERDTGARLVVRQAATEPALLALEHGEADVVVAPFASDTGWRTRVALSEPLDGRADDTKVPAPRVAARNGEHRWVMRLERLVRAGRGARR